MQNQIFLRNQREKKIFLEEPNLTQTFEQHPYLYLTQLNNIYAYYESKEEHRKLSDWSWKIQRFNKIKIPKVFYQNYVSAQMNKQQEKGKKQNVHKRMQKKEGQNIWNGQGDKIVIGEQMSEQQIVRQIQMDHSNKFLRKMLVTKKIPMYQRQQLYKQVHNKLQSIKEKPFISLEQLKNNRFYRKISAIKKRKIKKSIVETKKPKTQFKLEKTVRKHHQATLTNNSQDYLTFKPELQRILVRNRCLGRTQSEKEVRYGKKLVDCSISYQNIKKTRQFMCKIQNLIKN